MSFRGATATINLIIFALLKISPVGRNDFATLGALVGDKGFKAVQFLGVSDL